VPEIVKWETDSGSDSKIFFFDLRGGTEQGTWIEERESMFA